MKKTHIAIVSIFAVSAIFIAISCSVSGDTPDPNNNFTFIMTNNNNTNFNLTNNKPPTPTDPKEIAWKSLISNTTWASTNVNLGTVVFSDDGHSYAQTPSSTLFYSGYFIRAIETNIGLYNLVSFFKGNLNTNQRAFAIIDNKLQYLPFRISLTCTHISNVTLYNEFFSATNINWKGTNSDTFTKQP